MHIDERGVQSPLSFTSNVAACAVGSSLWLSEPPFVNNPSGSSPFCTYISLYLVYGNVLCMIQQFDLHLQLQYSKGNNEDFMMRYTISRQNSVLRLTDSNLSMYIELLKL